MGKHKKWTAEDDALLGTMTDKDAAKALGRSHANIVARRHRNGIEAFARGNGNQMAWADHEVKMLGTMSDASLAKEIGRSETAVATRRAHYRIPGYFSGKSPGAYLPEWQVAVELDQAEFFKVVIEGLNKYLGIRVTHLILAEATFLSVHRMKKLATAGRSQEPLSLSTRHHIWLVAKTMRKRDFGVDQKTLLGK